MATYTTLRIGSKGNDVKKLQQALGITADGIYGSQTAAAVKAYQKKNGLSVDGIAGNQTLGKLYGSSTTTNKTSTSTATNSGFKPSATTDAYANTRTQKEKELSALGKFTYDDYVQPDVVTEAFNKLNALQKPGEFQYGNQQALDDILNRLMNGEKFSYDVNGDALYQQYKDQFVNQGQLAMQDAMGQAAAMTGGYGNSYAQSVGQQTYQGYLQQLNDKIPELYKLALDKYNMDRQDLKDQYGLLKDDKVFEYGLHRDAVDDYNTERAYLTDQARWLSDDARDWYKTEQEQKFNEYSTEYGIIKDALDRADTNYWSGYGQDYKAAQDKIANDLALAQLQLDRDKLAEDKRQWNLENGYDEKGKKKIVDPVDTPKPKDTVTPDNNKGYDIYDKHNQANAVAKLNNKVKIHPENHHDAVMRDLYGSYKQYVAQMIEKSSLSDDEKAACILYYGISESDTNYKKK